MKKTLLTIALASSCIMVASVNARPGNMPQPPPADEVVVDMMTGYDQNENNSLNQDELVAALIGIREQHRIERQGERPRMNSNPPAGNSPLGNRPAGPGPGQVPRRGPPAPEEIAPQLIADFDTNSDAELNTEELLNAITFLHSRPGPGRGTGRPIGPPPAE